MVKIVVELNIELHATERGSFANCVYTTEPAVYQRLKELGLEELWHGVAKPRDGSIARLHLSAPLDSELVKNVLKILKDEINMIPSLHSLVPRAEIENAFNLRKSRDYTKGDLDSAELLRLTFTRVEIGYFDHQTDKEQYVVRAERRQKNTREFGCLFPSHAFAFAEPLKSKLEAEGLIGPEFKPVIIEPMHKAKKPLWNLTSKVVLPPCLLPLQQNDGEPFRGDLDKGCHYDEGGYTPVELRFNRSAVEALGKFDVAVTVERTGSHGNHAFRQVVVSQRFREVITKLKVSGVNYVPVHLAK